MAGPASAALILEGLIFLTDQLWKINEKLEPAYFARGTLYGSSGELELAVRDLSTAIKLAPNVAKNYNNRAWIYQMLGDREKAIDDLRKSIELDPANRTVIENMKLLKVQP